MIPRFGAIPILPVRGLAEPGTPRQTALTFVLDNRSSLITASTISVRLFISFLLIFPDGVSRFTLAIIPSLELIAAARIFVPPKSMLIIQSRFRIPPSVFQSKIRNNFDYNLINS